MKTVRFFFIAGFVCMLLNACKKDDIEPISAVDIGTVIKTETIGKSGGTIETDDMLVEIPAGAFDNSYQISISKLDKVAFGENQLTDILFVNNLPVDLRQPLKMIVDHPMIDENTLPFVVEVAYVPSLNKSELVYHKATYEKASSGLEITIPRLNNLKSASLDELENFEVGVVLVANMTEIISEAYEGSVWFNVVCETSLTSEAQQLAAFLDNTLKMLKGPPHNFDFSGRTSWPMTVTLTSLSSGVFGYFEPSMWGANSTSILLNSSLASNMEEMKITAGHEFVHFYQFLNDPRNFFSRAKFQSPYLWLDEAVCVYYEAYFAGNDSYISPVRKGNEHMPYQGGIAKEKTDAQSFGYGMAGMIKYLTRHLDPAIVSKLYGQIKSGNTVVDAIKNATKREYAQWWPFFIQKYSTGLLYSDINSGTLVSMTSKSNKFEVKEVKDSVFKHIDKYDGLESVIYSLRVNESALNDADNLEVNNSGNANDVSIRVFKLSSSLVEEAGSGSNKVRIAGIKDMTKDGLITFAVIVTNLSPGSDERELETTLRIRPGNTISISFGAGMETNTYENDQLILTNNVMVGYNSPKFKIVENANSVTSNWNNTAYNTSLHTGNLTMTIHDDNTLDLSVYDVVETSVGWKITYRIEAVGVTKTSPNRYESLPNAVVTSFRREVKQGQNYTIESTGPPFFEIGGSSGYLRIVFD